MNTLEYIKQKFSVNINQRHQPVEIPNTNRETLATLFAELGFTNGAEIGVEEGRYSEVLLKANPKLTLRSIDAWTAYTGYRDHMTQEEMDVIFNKAKERLSLYWDRVALIKGYSMEVAKQFEDETFDFVYIDANHEFTHVVNDIAAWEPKVRVGGIIAGHDYIRRKTNAYLMHVPMAVNGYCSAYQIKPLFVLGRKDAKANTNPKKGELRDATRSWFYVKQARLPIVPGYKSA